MVLLSTVHTYLFEHHKYEYHQGARIIPTSKRIGADLELVKNCLESKNESPFQEKEDQKLTLYCLRFLPLSYGQENGWM